MLTIKSNLNNFKNRQNECYTVEDLSLLGKAIVTSDIINFKLKFVGGGFTDPIATKIITKLSGSTESTVLVINDLSLHMLNKLLEAGYKKSNIYLAYGKWDSDGTISTDTTVYNIMKAFIKANIKEKLNVVNLEELFMGVIKTDIIIANPPYGKIGANITKTIIDKVNFYEYVNLLPANDYKRNTTKDLYNYQSDMIAINDGFADAAVTTHLAKIHKSKVNDMALDEFEISQYIDPQLDKYFRALRTKTHYAIDTAQARPKWTAEIQRANVHNSFIIHMRDANHGYIPNTGKATSVQWNKEKALTLDYIHENHWQNNTQSTYGFIIFNSEEERDNFTTFMLDTGWAFMCKVMKAMSTDCTVAFSKYLPKVDWTRAWTVEEILADYGYTETEIAEVIADLDNFKGMED